MSRRQGYRHPAVACYLRNIEFPNGVNQPFYAALHHHRRQWTFLLAPTDAFHVRSFIWAILMILFYFYKFTEFVFKNKRILCHESIKIKQILRRLLTLPDRFEPTPVLGSHTVCPPKQFLSNMPFDFSLLVVHTNIVDPFQHFYSLMFEKFSEIFSIPFTGYWDSEFFMHKCNEATSLLKDIFWIFTLFDRFALVHWNHTRRLPSGIRRIDQEAQDFQNCLDYLMNNRDKFRYYFRRTAHLADMPSFNIYLTTAFIEPFNDPEFDPSDEEFSFEDDNNESSSESPDESLEDASEYEN